MVTLSISTFSLGAAAGELCVALPALATFWMILSPLTIVPNGV